jgi:GTP-binding protein HflX
MNALTNAGQEIRGTLFSTLDTVIRQLSLPSQQKVLFLDTVGFLHRLPHHLVEAFKATLEEVAEADLLLQVLDVSHPLVLEQAQAVRQVLTEIGAEDKPIIYALNKIDLAQNEHQLRRLAQEFPQSAAVSALKKIGIEQLVQKIVTHFAGLVAPVKIFLPHSQMKLLNLIHTHAQIRKKEYAHDGIYLEAIVSREIKEQLSKFLRK